jgi:hypothetical protein
MSNDTNSENECRLVGEFIDEGDPKLDPNAGRCEFVRPAQLVEYVDVAGLDEGTREFTVLLKDGRILGVPGHGLKHESHPVAGEDVFSIFVRAKTEEIIVALFKAAEISGIFYGDVRVDRRSA